MPLSRRDLLIGTIGIAAVGCTSADGELDATRDTTATTDSPSTTALSEPPSDASTTSTTSTPPSPTVAPSPEWDGDDPFMLGIASGDPDAGSVVLWTRLVSSAGDALSDSDLAVALDVSADETFDDIVLSTVTEAPSAFGHSVHALVDGLTADTWFYYRFLSLIHI